MHFLTLATVEIPVMPEDETVNQQIINEVERLKSEGSETDKNFMLDFCIGTLNGRLTAFAREIENKVYEFMEPYCEQTTDKRYLEFCDMTDELQARYENDCEDCIRLANGKIVSLYEDEVYNYHIRDGKVYQSHWGPLKHEKRTKKSRKMLALPNYPNAKRYSSFKEYADRISPFDEEHGAYGFYWSPNAFYDWFAIGGRWPKLFLVKDECQEYSTAGQSIPDIKDETPDGYKWVCAARKKDIEWNVLYDWTKQKAVERYHKYRNCFIDGKLPEDSYARLTESGIRRFDKDLYIKDESLEEYLYRHCLDAACNHSIAFAYIENDRWKNQYDLEANCSEKIQIEHEWAKRLAAFIDGLSDDTVIVGVDIHQ